MAHTLSDERLPTAVHGDVASVEMMSKVKMEGSHEGTTDVLPWCQGDMQRVHPVAGEFLKRKVYLDDTMKVFKTREPPAGEEPWKTFE